LVVAVYGNGQHFLGVFLANDIFVELRDDFARTGNAREELFGRTTATAFLIENRLAKFDALAADVNIPRPFDQRPHIAITFAAKRTEGVLLCCAATATGAPADVGFSPVGHA